MPADVSAGEFNASLAPLHGSTPLTVFMNASGSPDPENCHLICAHYDFGNDAKYGECGWLYPCDPQKAFAGVWIDTTYVLPCPGIYNVTAYVDESHCRECPSFAWQVVVDPSPFDLAVICDPRETSCRLVAVGTVPLEYMLASTVDWGDGSGLETFAWVEEDGLLAGPSHDFGEAGYYTVQVINDIRGAGRSCPQTATVVANPGYTTPVYQSTWGKIKALYAK
jgi:hypothetical protein